MKSRIITLICITVFCCCLFGVSSEAASFDELDAGSASAGASRILMDFYSSNENVAEYLSELLQPVMEIRASGEETVSGSDGIGTKTEMIYEEPVHSMIKAKTSANVRVFPSALAPILTKYARFEEIYVKGQSKINGVLWYIVDYYGTYGYIYSDLVALGPENISAFLDEVHLDQVRNTPLPGRWDYNDDISVLPENDRNTLKKCKDEINYCLLTEYGNQLAKNAYVSMYSVLVYILENYTEVLKIASKYGLTDTYTRAQNDILKVELNRERLSLEDGRSDSELYSAMIEQAEAALKRAKELEQQEEYLKSQQLCYQIVNYAKQFIGWLPYVWGGASLKEGADCSGFCGQIYAHFGLLEQKKADNHDYDSRSLKYYGREVSIDQIQPGDMVCYNGHVAIYYGDDVVIHEPSPGKVCSYGNLYMMPIITIRRLVPN